MEGYRKKPLRGAIILLSATAVWGLSFVAQSEAMDFLEPITFNGIRILLGGLALIPVIFLFRRFDPAFRNLSPEQMRKRNRSSILGGMVCGVFMCAAATLQQYGIAMTSAGKSGFLTALYIVLVPVFGVLFKRRIRWISAVCVAMALLGFYFLSVQADFSIAPGDLILVLCALMFAFQILFIDHFWEKGVDGVMMCCVEFLTAGVILLPLMFLFEHPAWENILAARGSILYAGLLSGAVGYTLQILGQRDVEPTAASLLMSLESVFAVLFGWLLLGERLSARELLGCALVFAAVILSQVPVGEGQKR